MILRGLRPIGLICQWAYALTQCFGNGTVVSFYWTIGLGMGRERCTSNDYLGVWNTIYSTSNSSRPFLRQDHIPIWRDDQIAITPTGSNLCRTPSRHTVTIDNSINKRLMYELKDSNNDMGEKDLEDVDPGRCQCSVTRGGEGMRNWNWAYPSEKMTFIYLPPGIWNIYTELRV